MTTPKKTMYQLLGWKTHSKRSRYGHYFVNGKCVDCGKAPKEEHKWVTERR